MYMCTYSKFWNYDRITGTGNVCIQVHVTSGHFLFGFLGTRTRTRVTVYLDDWFCRN